MTYSVGNSEVANYANTSSGQVTNVVADDGLGGAGVVTNVVDRVALSFVVDTNIQFLTVDVTSLDDYVAGITDVTITVNPNVYVYGTPPSQIQPSIASNVAPIDLNKLDASLQIIGGAAGDTVKLINNGNILGYGGDGSGVYFWTNSCCFGKFASVTGPMKGNAALSFITPGISLSIENNGYIAGGGGGGGATNANPAYDYIPGGGGGAGGGISGIVGSVPGQCGGNATVRAVPPNAGESGKYSYILTGCCGSINAYGGGGGGFKLAPPDDTGGVGITGTIGPGNGGGAGGGGAVSSNVSRTYNNNGGSANNNATSYTTYSGAYQGGGGGGWGASGAAGYINTTLAQLGAAGGNSIVTNGNAYTLTGSGQLYGSVDTAITSVVYIFPATVETGTTLDLASIPGYAVGTNVVLIAPTSVRLASDDNATPGLTITKSGTSNNPSSVRIVINGAILGAGGVGGSEANTNTVGGTALYLPIGNITFIIDNTNGYLAGGGGGGGRSQNNAVLGSATIVTYGGGGAGLKGSSGNNLAQAVNYGVDSGVSVGNDGTVVAGAVTYASGGSGGTILPGVQKPNTGTFAIGTYAGLGGQAGGSGSFSLNISVSNPTNFGGAFKTSGGFYSSSNSFAGGGGGGWGSNGGSGRRLATINQSGATGGRAIQTPSTNNIFVASSANMAGSTGI